MGTSRRLLQSSVSRFMLPILKSHNKSEYELVGLNTGSITDEMTSEAPTSVTNGMSCTTYPPDAARLISDLKIDILIELEGMQQIAD